MQVFIFYENMLVKEQRRKKRTINDAVKDITYAWFFPHWFQHDISIVSRNKEISCFTHKTLRVYY